jgi:hypothetical protein
MNEKYYVVFDGTSAYPFAIEEIYGPFETFEEAQNREIEINFEIGNQ